MEPFTPSTADISALLASMRIVTVVVLASTLRSCSARLATIMAPSAAAQYSACAGSLLVQETMRSGWPSEMRSILISARLCSRSWRSLSPPFPMIAPTRASGISMRYSVRIVPGAPGATAGPGGGGWNPPKAPPRALLFVCAIASVVGDAWVPEATDSRT
eukprot:352421-Chlamydomonas_euryale.AAC.91